MCGALYSVFFFHLNFNGLQHCNISSVFVMYFLYCNLYSQKRSESDRIGNEEMKASEIESERKERSATVIAIATDFHFGLLCMNCAMYSVTM